MRAASRALVVLLAVAAVGSPAEAQDAVPTCPAAVGDLPLSVSVPFSGTPRPVAGSDGEIASTSLLCAYGEGVEPSVEVLLTWAPAAGCGTTSIQVAPGVDPDPFEALADDLAGSVGGVCPPAAATTFPVVPVTAVGAVALVVLLVGAVLVRRRRRRSPARSGTRSRPQAVGIGGQNDEIGRVEPELEPEPEPEVVAPEEAGPQPDLAPVLAELTTRHGRALSRSEQGQWLVVAALTQDAAALTQAGGRPGRRPARPELAALAEGLAHQATGADR